MPNFAGTWKMRSSENFDELLKALGVNAMLRKVAVAAASKPHVEIRQDGDQFYIKTSTTVRTTEINFKVGEGFEEETVDGRKCRVRPQSQYRRPRVPTPRPWPTAAGGTYVSLCSLWRAFLAGCVHWLFAEGVYAS
uniref:Cellular retinoic acid binding protein 1 n=1 Tax=Macaca nemestrina TaxID=9545 RepID=A0A2K6DTB2_MACNE